MGSRSAKGSLIEGKAPEPLRPGNEGRVSGLSVPPATVQIRAQFQLPDDLTEEEKLEPVRNFGDDPKIRLLNRLYEKKRRVRAYFKS